MVRVDGVRLVADRQGRRVDVAHAPVGRDETNEGEMTMSYLFYSDDDKRACRVVNLWFNCGGAPARFFPCDAATKRDEWGDVE